MYFTNEKHMNNFKKLVHQFGAENDPEYKAACYVLAVPDIYEKFDGVTGRNMFDWTFEFTEKKVPIGDDDWTYEREYKYDEDGKVARSEAYGILASSARHLLKLGANLFNSGNEFNMCDALGTWGNEYFKLYQQAVLIRIDRHTGMAITFN